MLYSNSVICFNTVYGANMVNLKTQITCSSEGGTTFYFQTCTQFTESQFLRCNNILSSL